MKAFEQNMPRLVAELHAESALRSFSEGGLAESAKLEQAIKANLPARRLVRRSMQGEGGSAEREGGRGLGYGG